MPGELEELKEIVHDYIKKIEEQGIDVTGVVCPNCGCPVLVKNLNLDPGWGLGDGEENH